MKKLYLLLFCISLFSSATFAKYVSPNAGVQIDLDYLVTNSNGAVTKVGTDYFVNDTIVISQYDIFLLLDNATVKFDYNTYFHVLGTMVVNPPDSVLFTAKDISKGYLGVHLDNSSTSVFQKLIMEYGTSFKISDNNPIIDNCIFRYNNNNSSVTFGSSAIVLFRSKATISNSKFLNNQRGAISGGANVSNAPFIFNNDFVGNNTLNTNVPHINLGASGPDTTKIYNNRIRRGSTASGGISFFATGDLHAVISGNLIVNNRYGINVQGGANMNTLISYNRIDSNNIEGNPQKGGSGIAFSGGTANSHQNSIVTGNIFTANLWGITIQNGSMPNLGNLTNADTTDDGKNYFINNTNSSTPGIDLYNNSPYPIFAQGNNWNTNDVNEIEKKIFHFPDQSSLGVVDFSNAILPLELVNFSGSVRGGKVNLEWATASENNTSHFEIERSEDGKSFVKIGTVNAAGNSAQTLLYAYSDETASGNVFYRLKMMDKDGKYQYSPIVKLVIVASKLDITKVYPSAFTGSQPITFEIESHKKGTLLIQVVGADGKVFQVIQKQISTDSKQETIQLNSNLPKGMFYLRFSMDEFQKTVPIMKQ